MCITCWKAHIKETADGEKWRAPEIPAVPHYEGEFMVCSDLHIPWHSTPALLALCEHADLLNIHRLIIAGDLVHADSLSRFEQYKRMLAIGEELNAARRILAALELVFDEIIIIPGNHDQRIQKALATAKHTQRGDKLLELVAGLLGDEQTASSLDIGELATSLLRHFLSSPKVTVHEMPDLLVNDTWLIQHPSSVSRVAPQSQRKMAIKHRKSVLEGHSHLWAVGFDESATDIVFNMGHMSDDDKFHYKRERPSHYPNSVLGFCAILQTKDNKEGSLLPVALHDRWCSLATLRERLG
jgi:predicted phosphodiesterase